MTNNPTHAAVGAVIYLKDGKRKYGMLVDHTPVTNDYQFISNDNILLLSETNNTNYIEIVPGVLIEAIDTNLK